MPFNVGENVGPYRIIEQLGQGGMATVFKAYHASLDRYVALKVLHPAFNQDPNFEARFQREARVVAKLEHPNIVPIYDYAEHEKRPYLVMKFIEGITLKARMDQGSLSSDEITRIVDAVGSALAYAHKQGVLHRDIKPSNVLMATDGQIYLADFGLARIAQSGESTLSSDMIMGTPQYISPEQAMGKADLDQRTDLYSFGVMLYEMVVGKVPFNADTPFSIIHDHIYSPLPLPGVVNPSVPEPVERVLLKALAKERDDRFDDATRLVEAFKGAWNEAGVPIQGSDVSASQVIPIETAEPTKVASMPEPAEPTKVASVPEIIARAEEKPKETEAVPTSKKKRSTLVWVGVALIVILCLGGLAVIGNNRNARLIARQQTEAPTPVPDRPKPENPPPAEEPPAQILPPHVREAQTFADEHPDDPDARLNLALIYWEAGLHRQTFETIPQITKLAGPENVDFYMHAGNEFAIREGWIPSASMFFQAYKFFQANGEVPKDLTDRFHEAMYKAATQPESQLFIPLDNVARVDEGIALITRARNAFYTDRRDEAFEFLAEIKRVAPAMPESRMLEAEFSIETGEHAKARLLAESLLPDDSSAAEWVRVFAEEILMRLPK